MSRVLLVDGNWLLWRAFHVALFRRNFKFFSRTIPSTVVSMIAKDFRETRSSHIAVAFDAPKSFRYKIYPHYKENRSEKTIGSILGGKALDLPSDVQTMSPYQFLPTIKTVLELSGIHWISVKNMESDDMLAAGALHLSETYRAEVLIETGDKDLMSVVSNASKICIYQPKVGKKLAKYIQEQDVLKAKGVKPSQMRDYLCLMGDAIDSIPGVPGIAGKTAVKLLTKYGSIAKALKSKDMDVSKLKDNINGLYLARKLVSLDVECWKPVLSDLAIKNIDENGIETLIGKVPSGIEELHSQKALASAKGLFR